MDIQAEKIELLKMILETDNPNILMSIKKLFKKEANHDFWDDLSEKQKEEIMDGLKEIEDGEVIKYEDIMKKQR